MHSFNKDLHKPEVSGHRCWTCHTHRTSKLRKGSTKKQSRPLWPWKSLPLLPQLPKKAQQLLPQLFGVQVFCGRPPPPAPWTSISDAQNTQTGSQVAYTGINRFSKRHLVCIGVLQGCSNLTQHLHPHPIQTPTAFSRPCSARTLMGKWRLLCHKQ